MPSPFVLRRALIALALLMACAQAWAQPPATRSPEVVITPSFLISAPEALKAYCPGGLPPGLGFGLNCAQSQPDGSMVLHTLTGRGPTAPGPTVVQDGQAQPSTIFILPGFHPSIVTMKLAGDKAEVVGMLPLKQEGGAPLSGLPPAPVKGRQASLPLGLALNRLEFDPAGFDPQGVAYDYKRGAFWLADGYRPALARVSPRTGEVLSVLDPASGLQEYLTTCRPGWGFTGVSLSPTGMVYTMLRGVLFQEGQPGIFSRIVELDPDTERVRQLPYPIEGEIFEDPARVATGDPVAFADKRLLVLEQGLDRQGRPRSLVFAVDLTKANNINKVANDAGQTPEALRDKKLLQKDISLPRKTLVLDLHEAGFKEAWAESMTLLADGRTLAFMGGHGFGLEQQIAGYATGPDGKPVLDPAAYALEPDGKLSNGGKPTAASIVFRPGGSVPRLWVVTLPKKASEY